MPLKVPDSWKELEKADAICGVVLKDKKLTPLNWANDTKEVDINAVKPIIGELITQIIELCLMQRNVMIAAMQEELKKAMEKQKAKKNKG